MTASSVSGRVFAGLGIEGIDAWTCRGDRAATAVWGQPVVAPAGLCGSSSSGAGTDKDRDRNGRECTSGPRRGVRAEQATQFCSRRDNRDRRSDIRSTW